MDNAEQPIDLVKKIMELAGGGLRFKHKFNTPEELLAAGAHNNAELERIEAIGVEVPGRIRDLLCLLMTEAYQPIIMNSQDPKTALRQFLLAKYSQPEYGWEKTRQLMKEGIATGDFTAKQLESIYLLVDALPQTMTDEIVEAVIPLMLIPKTESDKLTGILVEMFKEAKNADHS
jgi:hypothetical protein